jgi:DNA-binding MarR family transcriptional regulator
LPLSAPETEILDLAERLRPVILRLGRQVRREAQRSGVSPLDAMLLAAIQRRPGIGVSELAELERITRPAMCEHVNRLEQSGWIRREEPAADADQRRVALGVTAAGAAALDSIRQRHNDWLISRLAALPPEDQRALQAALGALATLAEPKP